MGQVDEIRNSELDYCRNNIEYFIDSYGHIEDKDAEELIQPFVMWKEQREALQSIMAHKMNVILKCLCQNKFEVRTLGAVAIVVGSFVINLCHCDIEHTLCPLNL